MIVTYGLWSVEMRDLYYLFVAALTIRVVTCHHVTFSRINMMSDVMIMRCLLATLRVVIVVVVVVNYMYPMQQGFG